MRRALACVAVTTLLPGCLAPEAGPRSEVRRATLGSGGVVLTAPRGYCIDPASLRRSGGGGGFALLASCESLSGVPGVAVAPALMTVSVLPREAGTPAPVAARLAAAVAPAPTDAIGEEDGLAYAHVLEGGAEVLPGGDPKYWRGARAMDDRLVGLAVYAPADSPLAAGAGRRLLSDLSAGLALRADAPTPPPPERPRGLLSWLTSGTD